MSKSWYVRACMRGHWWLSAVVVAVADVVGGKSDETELVVP